MPHRARTPDETAVTLEQGLAEFLTHLGLEKNASDKTVKSYREDLTQALSFARERVKKNHTDPADWNTRLLRGFVSWLHEQGYAKATVARRLAAVRSFGRFLCRQGVLSANPAQAWKSSSSNCKAECSLSRTQSQMLRGNSLSTIRTLVRNRC